MVRGSSRVPTLSRRNAVMRRASLLSSLLRCLTAVAVRSIRQVKIALYVVERVDRLIALANPLERGGGKVVILKVFQPIRDEFAQVVGLRAAGLAGETIKPRLGFGVKPN